MHSKIMKPLRAVVVGAGWAGEGHTIALRYTNVEVVAICSREARIVRDVADRLGVDEASTNWKDTIIEYEPDIVTVATPASLRLPVIELAAELGCHVMCEKPLACTVDDASYLYRLVEDAGIKHAYGATHCYDPSVQRLRELVRNEVVGTVREISMTLRISPAPPLMPWSWLSSVATGGGVLNGVFPHCVSSLEKILEGSLSRIMGVVKHSNTRVPVVPDAHDSRTFRQIANQLGPDEAQNLEWRESNADVGFFALMEFRTKKTEVNVSVLIGTGHCTSSEKDGMRLYGDRGAIIADGIFSYEIRCKHINGREEAVHVPEVGDNVQDNWCALMHDFLADIRGESHNRYPTFLNGLRYQKAVHAIRSGCGWQRIT